MGKRTGYEPGTFSWVELSTTDPEGAKEYYGRLFGWGPDDQPIPEEAGGGVYTMCRIGGESVAAIQEQRADQRDAGIPPNWFSYITVAAADEAAAKAGELGGTVHMEPFDVMDQGRMAVVADPTGAVFGIWQAGESIGATLVNDPGCLTSNELSTNDFERAREFYSALFGWTIEEVDTQGGPRYWTIEHGGAAEGRNGGMRELAQEQTGVPPHWMPYFTASSADEAIATTKGSGGAVHAGPIDIPAGTIAVLGDPQGAVFGIFEGEVDP
jgi:predicted enzyme related to lactoylglutathione lyase